MAHDALLSLLAGDGAVRPYFEDESVAIYHGDCREVLPRLGAVDLVLTDPPYKLTQAYSASVDADNLLAVATICWAAPMLLQSVVPGAFAAVYYDTRILPLCLEAFRMGGWRYLRNLTLYRRWGGASKVHGWMSTSDFVLLFQRPGAPEVYYGATYHDVYVKDGPELDNGGHPAQKPLEFVARILQNLCPPSGVVLDPFMGSGTTLRAAKDLGRKAIGIEIEERYCEVAAKRMSQMVLPLTSVEGGL